MVTAAIDATGRVVPGVQIYSEAGSVCRLVSPWPTSDGANGNPFDVVRADGTTVQVNTGASVGRGIRTYTFKTAIGETYRLYPASPLGKLAVPTEKEDILTKVCSDEV